MVIIRTNYDGQESPMLKKNNNKKKKKQVSWRSTRWFRRKRFLKDFLTIYEYGGHLGHVTIIMLKKFISLYPKATKFGSKCPSSD